MVNARRKHLGDNLCSTSSFSLLPLKFLHIELKLFTLQDVSATNELNLSKIPQTLFLKRQEYNKMKQNHKVFQLLTHLLGHIDPVLMRYKPSNDHCWIVLQYEGQVYDPADVSPACVGHGYSSSPPHWEHHLPINHKNHVLSCIMNCIILYYFNL